MARRFPKEPSLNRRAAVNPQKAGVYAICEGSVTEPEYIENYYRDLCKKDVILHPIEKGAGEPLTIVKRCIEKRNELKRRRLLRDDDQIWAIFDVDEHPMLMDAVELARTHDIFTAISNPCIEVWGLVHCGDVDRPMTRFDAQSEAARVIPNYHHDKNARFDWPWCKDRVKVAKNSAARGREQRAAEGTKLPKNVPSTEFDKFLAVLVLKEPAPKEE